MSPVVGSSGRAMMYPFSVGFRPRVEAKSTSPAGDVRTSKRSANPIRDIGQCKAAGDADGWDVARLAVCPVQVAVHAVGKNIGALPPHQFWSDLSIIPLHMLKYIDVLERHKVSDDTEDEKDCLQKTYRGMFLYDIDDPILSSPNLTRPYMPRSIIRTFRDCFTTQRQSLGRRRWGRGRKVIVH